MEKMIQDLADVRAGQIFFREGIKRMEEKLDKALDEHGERLRELESFKDKQLGLLGLAAIFGSAITWALDHLGKLFK